MRIGTRAAILAAFVGASGASAAADVAAIASYGSELGVQYYQVRCSDGARASLRVHETPAQVCVRRANAPEQCIAGATVRAAATLACR